MKKRFLFPVLALLSLIVFSSCEERAKDSKVLARINDYELTLSEFQYQLALESELDKSFKLTDQARKEFLEGLIRKELLIQEARRLKLDRRDDFVRAMERYWESTLIKDLLEIKTRDIEKRVYVSQEEIEARYAELKNSGKDLPPLEKVEGEIRGEIRERKKTEMLEKWISELRKKAMVTISEDLI